MKKSSLIMLLTAVLALGVGAQTENAPLENLLSEARSFKHKKRYVIKYDEVADQTNVFFHYATFKGVEEDTDDKFRTGIGAGFSFAGRSFSGSTEDYAITIAAGLGWSFLIDRKLSVTADGKNFDLGEGVRDASVERTLFGKKRTGEILLFKIKRADLENFADAARVEMSIGGRDYLLKAEHQQIFKNILNLGTP